jgi:hypothetical protein
MFVLVGFAVCLGTSALSGCATSPTKATTTDVVFVGDSLAEQAAQYLPAMIAPKTLTPQFFGGSAPCDWLNKDLGITPTSVVVISFTGNAISPCMADGQGGQLAGQAVVDKYRTDVVALVDEARSAHADVVLVGQPVHGDAAGGNDIVDGLNAMYAKMAARSHVSFVDAGHAVENADGSFAATLPCEPNEQQCDPSGSNVMRSDDGLHFCPGSPPPGPCPTYASGAFRFAGAIAEAVNG